MFNDNYTIQGNLNFLQYGFQSAVHKLPKSCMSSKISVQVHVCSIDSAYNLFYTQQHCPNSEIAHFEKRLSGYTQKASQ